MDDPVALERRIAPCGDRAADRPDAIAIRRLIAGGRGGDEKDHDAVGAVGAVERGARGVPAAAATTTAAVRGGGRRLDDRALEQPRAASAAAEAACAAVLVVGAPHAAPAAVAIGDRRARDVGDDARAAVAGMLVVAVLVLVGVVVFRRVKHLRIAAGATRARAAATAAASGSAGAGVRRLATGEASFRTGLVADQSRSLLIARAAAAIAPGPRRFDIPATVVAVPPAPRSAAAERDDLEGRAGDG